MQTIFLICQFVLHNRPINIRFILKHHGWQTWVGTELRSCTSIKHTYIATAPLCHHSTYTDVSLLCVLCTSLHNTLVGNTILDLQRLFTHTFCHGFRIEQNITVLPQTRFLFLSLPKFAVRQTDLTLEAVGQGVDTWKRFPLGLAHISITETSWLVVQCLVVPFFLSIWNGEWW